MYNTSTSSNGRGSSSPSSQKPHYNSSSNDKRYKKVDEPSERRYDDRSSSGRRATDEKDTSRRRKSRWDDEGGRSDRNNGGDRKTTNYTSSEYRKKSRSRSRSPVKYSSVNTQLANVKSELTATIKKIDNNWSDSSEDEDSRGKGKRNDGGRSYNDSKRTEEGVMMSENNNVEFKGVGLGLGYQYHVDYLTSPPFHGTNPNGIEGSDARNLISNNGSTSRPPPATTKPVGSGIQMKLLQPMVKPSPKAPPIKPKISSVFNVDDDDDEEEMPAECKMRMKNIGRETPTSAGPNSFGKTKMGFCNTIQIKERKLEEQLLKKK